MARRSAEAPPYTEILLATGDHAPSIEDKVRYLRELRAQSPEMALQIDNFMVQQLAQQHQACSRLRNNRRNSRSWLKTFSHRRGTRRYIYARKTLPLACARW